MLFRRHLAGKTPTESLDSEGENTIKASRWEQVASTSPDVARGAASVRAIAYFLQKVMFLHYCKGWECSIIVEWTAGCIIKTF